MESFQPDIVSNTMHDDQRRRFFDSMQELVICNPSFTTANSIPPFYLSIDTSQDMICSRKGSIISSGTRPLTDGLGTPFSMTPTPTNSDCWPTPSLVSISSSFSDAALQMTDDGRMEYLVGDVDLWMGESTHFPMAFMDTKNMSSDWPYADTLSDNQLTQYTRIVDDPALARGIFPEVCEPAANSSPCRDMRWTSPATWSTPQTIAPTATQSILSSSPMLKAEPSTPIRLNSDRMSYFGSSPMIEVTPPTLSSQFILSDSYSDIEQEVVVHNHNIRARRSRQRLERRPYERKNLITGSQKPRTVTGKASIGYEAFIPQNAFACSFPDCIDRATGKQKRFKRREHCKRHEKTVHNKADAKTYPCWVEGCTTSPFSRRDNLNMHFKTHAKNTPAHRNRYVATLDELSEFYDLDWQGSLTSDGYPIRDGVTTMVCNATGCRERFYTADGWQKHGSKEHRDSSERHCRTVSLKSNSRKQSFASDALDVKLE